MRWLATCLVVAGCGRLSFDARSLDAPLDDVVTDDAITSREIEAPEFTTTSAIFVDVPDAKIHIPPSLGLQWVLFVSAYLTSTSDLYNGPEARYLVDGTERGIGGTESIGGNPGPWQHFALLSGTDQSQQITFQLRDGAGGEARITHLHAVAVPLPATVTRAYASNDATVTVGTTPVEIGPFVLDVPTMDEYLVFLLLNASEAPGTSDIDVTWFDPSDATIIGLKNPRGSRQSTLIVRRFVLAPPTQTFRLEAVSLATAEASYARVLALRIADLQSFALQTSMTYASTPSGPIEVSALSMPVTPAAKYVAFGSMRIDDDCSGATATRGAHFSLDDARTSIAHLSGNCALDTTYGFLDLVTTRPTRLAAGISSGTGELVEHRESTLFVLGVD